MRLFLAVELDDSTRAAVGGLIDRLSKGDEPVKWVPRANLHVTMKFLGEAPDEQLPAIEAGCARAAAAAGPFELRLRGAGAFPNARRPRVLWVGIDAEPPELRALAAAAERELAPLGFPTEKRPFAAHVTIGRAREPHARRRPRPGRLPGPEARAFLSDAVAREAAFEGGTVRVAHLTLMRSQLRSTGPIYSAVKRFPLDPGA